MPDSEKLELVNNNSDSDIEQEHYSRPPPSGVDISKYSGKRRRCGCIARLVLCVVLIAVLLFLLVGYFNVSRREDLDDLNARVSALELRGDVGSDFNFVQKFTSLQGLVKQSRDEMARFQNDIKMSLEEVKMQFETRVSSVESQVTGLKTEFEDLRRLGLNGHAASPSFNKPLNENPPYTIQSDFIRLKGKVDALDQDLALLQKKVEDVELSSRRESPVGLDMDRIRPIVFNIIEEYEATHNVGNRAPQNTETSSKEAACCNATRTICLGGLSALNKQVNEEILGSINRMNLTLVTTSLSTTENVKQISIFFEKVSQLEREISHLSEHVHSTVSPPKTPVSSIRSTISSSTQHETESRKMTRSTLRGASGVAGLLGKSPQPPSNLNNIIPSEISPRPKPSLPNGFLNEPDSMLDDTAKILFNAWDTNRNNLVGLSEIPAQVLSRITSNSQDLLDRFDVDHDGKFSLDEFKQLNKAYNLLQSH